MEGLMQMLMEKAPWLSYVLMGLGVLVVVAQAIVPLTPSQKDDEFMKKSWVQSVIKYLTAFAPFQKKPKSDK